MEHETLDELINRMADVCRKEKEIIIINNNTDDDYKILEKYERYTNDILDDNR